jgi:uncharacterized protein
MAPPWVFRMRWLDLLFAHWPVDGEALRSHLPADVELETFDGRAWLGVVPFTMADVSPRGLPAIPRLSRFPEINVRTYVRHRGVSGVWFLSLDAASRPTVWGGRSVFHLPYHLARMRASRDTAGFVDSVSRRRSADVRFGARYRATGPAAPAPPGSFDAWSTDRKRLFAIDRGGTIWRSEIDHGPWLLQPASGFVAAADLAGALGMQLPDDEEPVLRYSARLDVRGWAPVRA